jgi:hypothetical protein
VSVFARRAEVQSLELMTPNRLDLRLVAEYFALKPVGSAALHCPTGYDKHIL